MHKVDNNENITLDERVYSEQVKLLYKALPASILANLIAGLLIIRIQWAAIHDTGPIIWLFCFESFMILRAGLYFKYERTPHIINYRFWGNAFNIAAGITGLLWGSAGIFMFPVGNELYQMTLIFCLLAMSAGAVSSHSFLKTPPFVFIILALMPLLIRFFFEDTTLSLALVFVLCLSIVYLLMSAKRSAESTANNIRLRFDAVDKEEKIKKSQYAASQANRAKDEFFSLMSHELRTPLNSIIGYGQLLRMDAKDDISKDNAQEVLNAGNHLLSLINEILSLSKRQVGGSELKSQAINLNKIMEECLLIIRPLAIERHIIVEDEISTNTDYVFFADQVKIKQILINLLSNAVKYNKEGGRIRLHCSEVSPDRLRICVTDVGIGMTEEQISRLFVPFERMETENMEMAVMGVGLHMTKFLLQDMGGDIGVESVPGQGSTFWIEVSFVTEKISQ